MITSAADSGTFCKALASPPTHQEAGVLSSGKCSMVDLNSIVSGAPTCTAKLVLCESFTVMSQVVVQIVFHRRLNMYMHSLVMDYFHINIIPFIRLYRTNGISSRIPISPHAHLEITYLPPREWLYVWQSASFGLNKKYYVFTSTRPRPHGPWRALVTPKMGQTGVQVRDDIPLVRYCNNLNCGPTPTHHKQVPILRAQVNKHPESHRSILCS